MSFDPISFNEATEANKKINPIIEIDSAGDVRLKGFEPVNVLDPSKVTVNKYVSDFHGNGNLIYTDRVGAGYTDFIPCKQGDRFIAPNSLGAVGAGWTLAIICDSEKKGIRRIWNNQPWAKLNPFEIEDANASFVVINLNLGFEPLNQLMIAKGEVFPQEFVPFGQQYLDWSYPKPEDNPLKIHLSFRIYGILNEELRVYHTGCVSAQNPSMFRIRRDDGSDNARFVSFPTNVEGTQPGKTVTVLDQVTGRVLARRRLSTAQVVTNPATKANPATNKNILCIGDSLTDAGVWHAEFARRLTGTGGNPAGYGFSNFTFIGTRQKNGFSHEGRSGYSWEDYTYAPNDPSHGRPEVSVNPFWNTSENKLDFQKYMSDNGFSGDIDYAVIMLGWNDFLALGRSVETITETAKLFIGALKQEYPNCKVLLCGINTTSPHPSNNPQLSRFTLNDFALRLGSSYDNDICGISTYPTPFTSYTTYVPVTQQFDSEFGMPHEKLAPNARSVETVKICTDQIHPAENGYLQIADIILATFLAII